MRRSPAGASVTSFIGAAGIEDDMTDTAKPPGHELIDRATLARIERRLREVQFGEVVVVIHQGRVQEIKTTRRERPGE